MPYREIRALYTPTSIRVYQAYGQAIAQAAIAHGTLVPPFKMERMTWIKPSFLWMMYRSGWGRKDGQECILAIDITREGFEWALQHAVLSTFDPAVHASYGAWQETVAESCVRVQWDPEKDLSLSSIDCRAIQIGLRGEAVERYVHTWIQSITDISDFAHQIEAAVAAGDLIDARALLPDESVYPVSEEISVRLGMQSQQQ